MGRRLLFVLLLLPFLGMAQFNHAANDAVSEPIASTSFSAFLSGIRHRSFKSEQKELHQIFIKAHKLFLKKYEAYAEFRELFTSGKYDCLTATTFFSQVLNELHFQYSLIETNYHIFLIVHTRRGDILLETTDRFNGFVTDTQKIQERIEGYRQNLVANTYGRDRKIYHYRTHLYNEINSDQLQGLLYFNQAVKSFNNSKWDLCADMLDRARSIYDSPRVTELAWLLIRAVNANEPDEFKKQKIVSRLTEYLITKSPELAAL